MFRIDCQIKYLDYEANNKPTFDVTLRRDSQNTKPSPQELNDFQRAQSGINYRPTLKGGAMNLKVGGGQCIGRWGVGQYSKNTYIWKRWRLHDPPTSHGGAAAAYTVEILALVLYDKNILNIFLEDAPQTLGHLFPDHVVQSAKYQTT